MNNSRKYCHKRHKLISDPINFQHLHHVTYDSNESIFHGLPSEWRENVLTRFDKSDSDIDNAANLEHRLISAKSSASKRFRLIPKYLNPLYSSNPISGLNPANLLNNTLCSNNNEYNNTHCLNNIEYNNTQCNFFSNLNLINENPLSKIKNVNLMYEFNLYIILFGSFNDSNEINAFKFYRTDNNNNLINIKSEIEFNKISKHKNIVEFFGAYFWSRCILMVFKNDFEISLSDMLDHIYNIPRFFILKRYDDGIVTYIVYSIIIALQYVHSLKYIHRDLKSDNILLSPSGIIKLSDFGACIKVNENYITSDIIGTPYWMAPEIARKEGYSFDVDIWSLGSVLHELLTGKPLFYELSPEDALEKLKTIQSKEDLEIKSFPNFSHLVNPFIECCLAIKRNQRANSSNLMIHPFLSSRSDSDALKEFLLLFSTF